MQQAVKEQLRAAVMMMGQLLLDEGEAIEVVVHDLGRQVIILVKTTKPGAIIGKRGTTISPWRLLIQKVGQRFQKEFSLEVDDEPLPKDLRP